ncbi:MAG TPA: glycosyltransferase family A protein [Chthonomonadaceae bacterium]|nr:glycosyltransferase family A protein [Chthonomonadaceae bacterium]
MTREPPNHPPATDALAASGDGLTPAPDATEPAATMGCLTVAHQPPKVGGQEGESASGRPRSKGASSRQGGESASGMQRAEGGSSRQRAEASSTRQGSESASSRQGGEDAMPLVSIVLPTYNRAQRLAGSIESCLAQTYANIEVLVIDDGSTDDTPAVAEAMARRDARVRYIRQPNGKLPAALNTGHRAASGEYLTWTSDDNRYEPDAVATMVGFLANNAEYGMVYCDMEKAGPGGEALGPYVLLGPEHLPETSCVGACFLYRRAVYEAVGDYSDDTFLAEDYDYWLRVYLAFNIKHLSGTRPYRYGVHPESLTSRRQAEVIVQTAKVRCRHVTPPSLRRQVMRDAYWNALWYHRDRKDWSAAWPCARECLRLAPLSPVHWKAAIGTGLLALGVRAPRPAPPGKQSHEAAHL